MKITYDAISKALYFYTKSDKIEKTVVMNDRVNVDVNSNGEVVGIEILEVPQNILTSKLLSGVIPYSGLV